MKCSIVIRAKNEGKSIGKTLSLLYEQRLRPHEVIVVDNLSTDDTLAVVAKFKEVKAVNLEKWSFGRSLNRGCQEATGEFIVSLSAHAYPIGDRWLENLLIPFSDPAVAGVWAKEVPCGDAWPPVRRTNSIYYNDDYKVQSDINKREDHIFSNMSSAFRRSLWQEHQFNEQLPYMDDVEWAIAMLRRGHKIIYEPKAKVIHSHNVFFKKLYKQSRLSMLAVKILYGDKYSTLYWLRMCKNDIRQDWKCILKSQRDYHWFFMTVLYRLISTYGYIRADKAAVSKVEFEP